MIKFVVLFLVALSAHAEWRLYMMPLTGTGTPKDRIRPKYADSILVQTKWRLMTFGVRPAGLVAADVTSSTHNSLASQPDVFDFPQNLDMRVSQRPSVAKFGIFGVPTAWIMPTTTFREIAHYTAVLCLFLQKLTGFLPAPMKDLYEGSVTNNTRLNALPKGVLDAVTKTAQAFKLTPAFNNNLTVQQALDWIVFKWVAAKPITLGGFSL